MAIYALSTLISLSYLTLQGAYCGQQLVLVDHDASLFEAKSNLERIRIACKAFSSGGSGEVKKLHKILVEQMYLNCSILVTMVVLMIISFIGIRKHI